MKPRLVTVPCRLDGTNAGEFEQSCRNAIDAGTSELEFDFQHATYVSSAGLRSVLAVGKEMGARGGTLRLLNLNGMVRQIFDLSGFLTLFPHQP